MAPHTLLARSLALATCVGLVLTAPAAQADPKPEDGSFLLVCGEVTYEVVVNGDGDFTPAHDVGSTRTFVPTSFGEFTVVVTDADGEVVDTFTDPVLDKGSSNKPRRTSLTCTYGFEEHFVDPELGPLHIEGSGTVTGFYTPVRR